MMLACNVQKGLTVCCVRARHYAACLQAGAADSCLHHLEIRKATLGSTFRQPCMRSHMSSRQEVMLGD